MAGWTDGGGDGKAPTRRGFLWAGLALLAGIGAGCAAGEGGLRYAPSRPTARKFVDDRFGVAYMAFALRNNLKNTEVPSSPVIVTTFVDLNDLNHTSVLGRLLAEKLIDELSRNGFDVSEIRKARDLFIREQVGETILSRDAADLLQNSDARAILVGTYVATGKALMINCRLLDIHSPRILSSCSYELAMSSEVQGLLSGEDLY